MTLAAELINLNGISVIALSFFTALFGMVGWLIKVRQDEKKEIRDAKRAAEVTAESVETIVQNTKNVGNGFASRVLGKLERIYEKVDALEEAHTKHLEWHLERDKKS